MKYMFMLFFCLLTLFTSLVLAKDDGKETIKTELHKNFSDSIKALHSENLDGYMSTIHDSSLVYSPTKQAMTNIFKTYDLKYEILKYALVAVDSDYAYMRVLQSTKKIKGPAFRDNKVDALHVFKKKKDKWLLWQTSLLSIEYIP